MHKIDKLIIDNDVCSRADALSSNWCSLRIFINSVTANDDDEMRFLHKIFVSWMGH